MTVIIVDVLDVAYEGSVEQYADMHPETSMCQRCSCLASR
jgi:hypothetical protein